MMLAAFLVGVAALTLFAGVLGWALGVRWATGRYERLAELSRAAPSRRGVRLRSVRVRRGD